MKHLEKTRLTQRAHEFFGGDVQRFHLLRKEPGIYVIEQVPHWGNPRIVAVAHGDDAREAATIFNNMARNSDRAHC